MNDNRTLSDYLALRYSFDVIADPDSGYVIKFPDLPGCMTQVETMDDLAQVADEIRILWLETAYEQGVDIPMPSSLAEYSGRFNLRIPRGLHRDLAESADREGVSLNQYACSLLASGNARRTVQQSVQARLEVIEAALKALPGEERVQVDPIPIQH